MRKILLFVFSFIICNVLNAMNGFSTNLDIYGIKVRYNNDDLIIYIEDNSRDIENKVKIAINQLLKKKIGTEMYSPSVSVKTNTINGGGTKIVYEYFFSGSRITNSKLTQDQWCDLIDVAINDNF